MPNTFSQIYVQIVFAVKGRQSLISRTWEESLYKYISGIITKKEQKLLAINGMPDHIHLVIGLKPTCTISDLVREIKKSSNEYINDHHFAPIGFKWQEGYGVFSYSHKDLDNVIQYVINQKEHHKKKRFKEEYLEFLEEFKIEFKEEYLFEWIE
jgi:REP element-mobilizing transposase RayT